MQHHDIAVTLPLRLAAEPYAKDAISEGCVSLGIANVSSTTNNTTSNVEMSALADDDGIHAFCISELLSRDTLLERLALAVPSSDIATTGWQTSALLVLVRVRSSNNGNDGNNQNLMQWHWFEENTQGAKAISPTTDPKKMRQKQQCRPVHNAFVAELITNSIRHYYSQQILEPSVRGFLGVLEKQFARADLYLFELLQNAVDDGASIVEFSACPCKEALYVRHNGRPFTPLDVLGLSSVGLSTKSRPGAAQARTIGFMGIGFKAVYKRYARVCIDDGIYRFVYQEPSNNQMGYGWVMLPLWESQQRGLQQLSLPADGVDRTRWCQFSLLQPRGGFEKVQRDLVVLPRTAPPLLGRAALVKMELTHKVNSPASSATQQPRTWVLDWNLKHHTIERFNRTSYSFNDGSELIVVTIANNKTGTTKNNHWLFVTHKYLPSQEAAATYRNHTKRSHDGLEEVCGFLPLIGKDDDIPHTLPTTGTGAAKSPSGVVHSILPTKIRMPVPLHFQGSWLLSVDRQQVQDLTDNAWNAEILKQFPHLIATLFRWAAAQQLGAAAHYRAICQLLPETTATAGITAAITLSGKKANSNSNQRHQRQPASASTEILGQRVSLKALEQAFWSEKILPVGIAAELNTQTNNEAAGPNAMDIDDTNDSKLRDAAAIIPAVSTGYYEGAKTIWVPPSWFGFLDADFIRGWLGKRPLRTDLMGKAAFHPLFASEQVVGQLNPLPTRTSQLAMELGVKRGLELQQDSVWNAIRLMAAIGSAYDEYPGGEGLSSSSERGALKKQNKLKQDSKSSSAGNANRKHDEVEAAAYTPSLPSSIADWPVFITETGGMARLDQVVLPGTDFAELPKELLSLLRPHFIYESSAETDNYQQQKKFGGGKRDKKNKRPQRPLPLQRVHNLLESAVCTVDCYILNPVTTIPESYAPNQVAWNNIATSSSSFLKRIREQLPANVVDVPTASSNLLESYSVKRELSEQEVFAVLQLSKFAFETSNHLLIKFVLVNIDSSTVSSTSVSSCTRLVQATAAYIGKDLDEAGPGADLQNFAGTKLQYISSRYNSIIADTSVAKRKAIHMFVLAGVQTGMSIAASVVVNADKDKRMLATLLRKLPDNKLPSLRKNATKSEVVLPYGLGVTMNKSKFYLLDSQLPAEWERLASAMTPASTIGFISLLLAIPVENATIVTPNSVTAAAMCLAGRSDPSIEIKAASKDTDANHCKIPKNTFSPLRRRLYFLPTGQPGAKALDVSESRLVEQLQSIKWLPCSIPAQQQVTLTLLRPREALLEADSSRPEMPVVELPMNILKRLKTSQIGQALTWGTHAPPPPVGELAELAREAERLLAVDPECVDKEAVVTVALRLFDAWNAVCRSHLRDGLSQQDKKMLLRVLLTSPCIPVRRVLDSGGSGNWIVSPERCICMPDSPPNAKSENETLKHLTVSSLVKSDFVCNFSHSNHNPFFHQPEISNAIVQLAGIRSLANIQTSALMSVGGAFVRHCCAAEPIIPSRASPLRDSFTFCLHWCLESPKELPKNGQGLKLYVRHGPGMGAKALPARWIPLKGAPVQGVINDNKTRSALLSPEMNIQLLGVLDHSENEKNCASAKLLSAIDAKLIKAFSVLRLSDKRFIVKTRARGIPTALGGDVSSNLQLILALLRAMEIESLGSCTNLRIENNFLEQAPTMMFRHDSLIREFQAPGMEAPTSIPLYAIFGRVPKVTKQRALLVCGEPDDYSMDLEELVLNHVGVRTNSSLTQMKPYRAAVRLLSHLENGKSFNKFVERDFSDFEVTIAWKRLLERKKMLKKLQEADQTMSSEVLRLLLIQAEEIFDDDDDNGDSLLQSARDLLSKVEEEESMERQKREEEVAAAATAAAAAAAAKSKLESASTPGNEPSPSTLAGNSGSLETRGRGRGIDNRPAWMTGNGVHDNLSKSPGDVPSTNVRQGETPQSGPADQSQTTNNGVVEAESSQSSTFMAANSEENLPFAGRGRGMGRTLPAWMTADDGPTKATEVATSSEAGGNEDGASNPAVLPVGSVSLDEVGRGRGMGGTMPAWMTSGSVANTPEQRQSLPPDPSVATAAGSEALPSTNEQAKFILSSILKDASTSNNTPGTNEAPITSAPPLSMTGRGRGVSNLPAWMTASSQDRLVKNDGDNDALKRSHPSSPSNEPSAEEEARITKKSRLAQEEKTAPPKLRLTLDIDLVPSQESDFMAWFEHNVTKEVTRQGGFMTVSTEKHPTA